MLSIYCFESLVSDAETALLRRAPATISYTDTTDFGANSQLNEDVIAREVGEGANIYALWSRARDSEENSWQVMYIGQRTRKRVIKRIKQHLFSVPSGTQSKLEQVKQLVMNGNEIGISAVLVTPDSMRLSVEDQLIFKNTNSETDLPWNNKSRKVSLPRVQGIR